MDRRDRQRLTDHFALGFRELQVRDIQRSDESDVRMEAFIQCAALIDALALAYSSAVDDAAGAAEKWRRFVAEYFPPKYAPIADEDKGLRCLLVLDFSAAKRLTFTEDEPQRHLRTENDRLILDRGRFVAEVVRAFEAFEHDVLYDDGDFAESVLAWLDRNPPVAFSVSKQSAPPRQPAPVGAGTPAPVRARAAQPARAPSIKTRSRPKKRR